MKFWSVPRIWPGETVFLLGGGPSLRGFDPSVLDGRRVIAINNSWELKPDADVLYFCDSSWWTRKKPKAEALAGYGRNGDAVKAHFRGEFVVTIGDLIDPRVKRLRNGGKTSLSGDPSALKHGTNSGYQAINLAYLFGASRIVLLGYDMRTEGNATHWHAGHGHGAAVVEHKLAKVFLPYFPALVQPLADAGVEVINATPGSALQCWPHVPLADILKPRLEIVAA
jgi:hypothetical protein